MQWGCGISNLFHDAVVACGLEPMFGMSTHPTEQSYASSLQQGIIPGHSASSSKYRSSFMRARSVNPATTQLQLADQQVRSLDAQLSRQETELRRMKKQAANKKLPMSKRRTMLTRMKELKKRMERSVTMRDNILRTTASIREQRDSIESVKIIEGLRDMMKAQIGNKNDREKIVADMEETAVDLVHGIQDATKLSEIVSQPIRSADSLVNEIPLTEEEFMEELDALVNDDDEEEEDGISPLVVQFPYCPQQQTYVNSAPFPERSTTVKHRPAMPMYAD